jgi:hypothetical protein
MLRVLGAFALFAVFCFFASCSYFSLHERAPSERVHIVSDWKNGELVRRAVVEPGAAFPDAPTPTGGYRVVEEAVADAPLPSWTGVFEVGVVPGMDGVAGTLNGKTGWVTTDDLLKARAYDHTTAFGDTGFGMGLDRAVVLGSLATQLGASARDVDDKATFRRVRFARSGVQRADSSAVPLPKSIYADDLTPEAVHEAIREASRYLARNLDPGGKFRYIVDAPSDKSLAGYSWPRHAGATFFLAQAAGTEKEPDVAYAALRAAAIMRDSMMKDCGAHKCIAEDDDADLGSSALGLVAFTEVVRRDLDRSYLPAIRSLAEFIRSQQRADGEFMHEYDRPAKKPIDIQRLYFSGEATLALARAYRVTNDPQDLDAAKRGLARLVGTGWHFFGDRYYFSEEHWTCQALDELWDKDDPNWEALRFCERWHEYQRRLQYGPNENPMDADGAFGVGNFVSPRLTPASSRGEAAGATLSALRKEYPATYHELDEDRLLARELDAAVAYVVRNQWRPGPVHLFANPEAVRGAMPGSAVDWQIRIDYLQHAGSMLVRWLELREHDFKTAQN